MIQVSSSPKSSPGERQPWTAVWGECTGLGEQPHHGVTWHLPRDPLGSSCPCPLPRSPARPNPSPQPGPLSAGMAAVPCHQPPICSYPSSPPCTRLRLPFFLLQPRVGSSLSPSSPISIWVAPWGPDPLPPTLGGTPLSPWQGRIWPA